MPQSHHYLQLRLNGMPAILDTPLLCIKVLIQQLVLNALHLHVQPGRPMKQTSKDTVACSNTD